METQEQVLRLANSLNRLIPFTEKAELLNKIAYVYYLCRMKNIAKEAATFVEDTETLLYFAKDYDYKEYFKNLDEFKESISLALNDLKTFIKDERVYSIINNLFYSVDDEVLLACLNYNDLDVYNNFSTPTTISELVLKIADFYKVNHSKLIDMTCGSGSFLLKASKKFREVEGVEIDKELSLLAKMKLYANGIKGHIVNDDCFNHSWHNQSMYNTNGLVFAEFPWKLNTRNMEPKEIIYNCNANRLLLTDNNTFDFYFVSAMLNYIEGGNGLAITVVPLPTLFTLSDINVRKGIIDKGYLKAVILLPENLFYKTSASSALLVFSDTSNKKVLLLDGSKYLTPKNRMLNNVNIELLMNKIEDSYKFGTNFFSKKDFEGHDWSFYPLHYNQNFSNDYVGKKELCDIADVFTGWQVSSSKLNEIHNSADEGSLLLQMSNIDDGTINNNLEHYDIPDSTVQKFKLKKGDIVITSKTAVAKSAVFDSDFNHDVIPAGSIIVVRPHLNELDSYFLCGFLESNVGREVLKMCQSGTSILNLTISNVKKLLLPKIDINAQKSLGSQYKSKRDTIIELKSKIQNLKEEINSLMDDTLN